MPGNDFLVSIRASAWDATLRLLLDTEDIEFLSARPRGTRRCLIEITPQEEMFLSARPRGTRLNHLIKNDQSSQVSIRASAWDATFLRPLLLPD